MKLLIGLSANIYGGVEVVSKNVKLTSEQVAHCEQCEAALKQDPHQYFSTILVVDVVNGVPTVIMDYSN